MHTVLVVTLVPMFALPGVPGCDVLGHAIRQATAVDACREQYGCRALQESGAADPPGAAEVPQMAAALMRAAAAELNLEVGGVSKL